MSHILQWELQQQTSEVYLHFFLLSMQEGSRGHRVTDIRQITVLTSAISHKPGALEVYDGLSREIKPCNWLLDTVY